MLGGDVMDQFHDDDSLADSGSSEEADFASAKIRLEQINDLDPRLEHLELGALLDVLGRRAMDGHSLFRLDGPLIVHRLAEDVHHSAKGFLPDRHRNRSTGVENLHPSHHTVGGLHGHRADAVLPQMLLDLDHDIHGHRR